MHKLTFFFALVCMAGARVPACTTLIVGKNASADGGVIVAHSDDGHITADSSVVYVPAKPIEPGGARAVYPSAIALRDLPEYNAFLTPRLSADDDGPGYRKPGFPRTTPIGAVPYGEIFAVLGESARAYTYAYLDGNYGIANEYGLMFGECTNGAKVSCEPVPGKRIFYSTELSRLALENCKTAKDAVKLIGYLIDTYGYWGTGETLPVGDAEEAWVIEMAPLPPEYGKAGGLWTAKKVPGDEFFIAANEFRIREIDPAERGKTLMYGDNLFEVAKDLGWYAVTDPQSGLMDWLATVSRGEYSHPYYSLRRVWRGLDLAAPSLKLSPWVRDGNKGLTRDYPFSVKPDKKLSLADIMALYRDHYEGTEFDMTQGQAAGPYGNPNRYLGHNDAAGDIGSLSGELVGAWERPIGVYYTNLTYINQARADLPYPLNVVSWIALNPSAESVFVPLAIAPPPPAYERYDSAVFDPDGQAWRIYNLVGEYANIKYGYMIKDIRKAALAAEAESAALVESLRHEFRFAGNTASSAPLARFNGALNKNAEAVRARWRALFGELVVNYNQGLVNTAPAGEKPDPGVADYPDDWLKGTDYFRGPTVYKKKTQGTQR